MKLSLVLSTHQAQFEAVALKGDFAANAAKIAAWGYDGVELAVRDPALVDADALAKVVAAHGLAVPAIGTGQAWGEEGLSFTSDDPAVRAAAIARIQSHVPLAARLDALIIIGLIRGITPAGQTHAQSMAYFAEAMRACAETARAAGVRLAIEPLNRYETDLIHTAAEGLAFLETVGMDNVGLLLDTFHMNIEEPDIGESIAACVNPVPGDGGSLFHFHVADSNRWYPGAGHLDFAEIVSILNKSCYTGYVSGEFLPRPDADTAAARAISHLRSL
jgi:5-keto-L-gluconate epimerase